MIIIFNKKFNNMLNYNNKNKTKLVNNQIILQNNFLFFKIIIKINNSTKLTIYNLIKMMIKFN